jgi:2-amino-4-hydroxy-6-hydroxymethyldihydropteridine diphosphokinase
MYSSDPVDAQGPVFINTVTAIDTTLDPLPLLDLLQAIEQAHGRERPYRNAPRTLDLDLLLYGKRTINTPRLTVPHPRMHQRAFVLRPLQDLAPNLQLAQGSFTNLLAACQDQKLNRLLD